MHAERDGGYRGKREPDDLDGELRHIGDAACQPEPPRLRLRQLDGL